MRILNGTGSVRTFLFPFIALSILGGVFEAAHACIRLFETPQALQRVDDLTVSAQAARPTNNKLPAQPRPQEPLVIYNKDGVPIHLSERGAEKFSTEVIKLRENIRHAIGDMVNMEGIVHAAIVSRLLGSHFLMSGPASSGKTQLVERLLQWESGDLFQLLGRPGLNEMAIQGGENFKKLEEGLYVLNPETSLAMKRIGHLDEFDKLGLGPLVALLNVLEGKKLYAGSQVFDLQLETLYATSNANLAEILINLRDWGYPQVGEPLFSRFLLKAHMHDFHPHRDLESIILRRQRSRDLDRASVQHPELKNDQAYFQSHVIDWAALRELYQGMIRIHPMLVEPMVQFADMYRDKVAEAREESETKFKQGQEILTYQPTTHVAPRTLGRFSEIITASAFVDFIMSSMANEGNVKPGFEPIYLDLSSMHRLATAVTLIENRGHRLVLDEQGELTIKFDSIIKDGIYRDSRERWIAEKMKLEQDFVSEIFTSLVRDYKDQIDMAKRALAGLVFNAAFMEQDAGFEMQLMRELESRNGE